MPTQGGNQTCRLQTASWLKDYLHVSSYPSLSWPTPQLDQPCQQLLPCACLNMSRLQQLKLQNFAVPVVCVTLGRQAARRQLCRSKGSVSSTRGPEVSNWRQKPFAPKHAQCNAVMLLAQLHQVGNRDEERKKASSQRDLRHPSYHSLGAAPLLNPCLFSCAKPSGHLSGACRRQLSAQQGRWQAGGTPRLLLLATGTSRWVQEAFRLQMSRVRWANRIPLLQSVAASTRQIL